MVLDKTILQFVYIERRGSIFFGMYEWISSNFITILKSLYTY